MEIHVTRSVELVVCLAAIDTMVTVCVDLGGGETDVTILYEATSSKTDRNNKDKS